MSAKASFFSLLRAGLWGTEPDETLFRQENTDWKEVIDIAINQTVPGIVFDGVEKLPAQLHPPRPVMMKWLALVARIEQANEKLNHELAGISKIYTDYGVPFILLKGQGCASAYLRPEHRQCGDLDLYVGVENYKRINQYMSRLGSETKSETDKHAGFIYNGVSVENHCYAATFSSPLRNRKLRDFEKKWLNEQGKMLKLNDREVFLPAPGYNAIYLLIHSLLHFIQEGIGLRQVCDWTRMLYVYADEIDRNRFVREVNELKLEKAFGAFGFIAINYLGLPARCFPFPVDQKSGEFLLADILKGGNFGKSHASNRHETGWKKKYHTFAHVCKRCQMMSQFYPSESRWYPYFRIKSLIVRLVRGEA